MKKISFLIILFLPILSLSQSVLSKSKVDQYTTMFKKAQGTYQIQMINTRKMPVIPLSLISKIEKKRHQSEDRYFNFKENIKIKILPKDVIESTTFEPIERIVHLNSNQRI